MLPLLPWLLALWALGVAAWDVRYRRVPHAALIAAAAVALVLLVARGQGPLGAGWASSAAGAALGLALWLPGYRQHRLGAGDVKLAGCIGLLLGVAAAAEAMLYAALLLGLMAAGARLARRPQARLPAAVAFAGGMLLRLFGGPQWIG